MSKRGQPLQVREATRADVAQIVRIFHDTVHAVNVRDYTPEQINAWSPAVPDTEAWTDSKFPSRTTFVADADGTIAGFGELENSGHIDCFYCHHEHQRRGVGSAILRKIEDAARTLGLARLFVESSITARPFFEAHGFTGGSNVVLQVYLRNTGQSPVRLLASVHTCLLGGGANALLVSRLVLKPRAGGDCLAGGYIRSDGRLRWDQGMSEWKGDLRSSPLEIRIPQQPGQ